MPAGAARGSCWSPTSTRASRWWSSAPATRRSSKATIAASRQLRFLPLGPTFAVRRPRAHLGAWRDAPAGADGRPGRQHRRRQGCRALLCGLVAARLSVACCTTGRRRRRNAAPWLDRSGWPRRAARLRHAAPLLTGIVARCSMCCRCPTRPRLAGTVPDGCASSISGPSTGRTCCRRGRVRARRWRSTRWAACRWADRALACCWPARVLLPGQRFLLRAAVSWWSGPASCRWCCWWPALRWASGLAVLGPGVPAPAIAGRGPADLRRLPAGRLAAGPTAAPPGGRRRMQQEFDRARIFSRRALFARRGAGARSSARWPPGSTTCRCSTAPSTRCWPRTTGPTSAC